MEIITLDTDRTEDSDDGAICESCGRPLSSANATCESCSLPGYSGSQNTLDTVVPKMSPGRKSKGTSGGTVVIQSGVVDASNRIEQPLPVMTASLALGDQPPIPIALYSEADRFVIGRDYEQCDTVLDDVRASRTHCAIGIRGHEAFVEDLGSTNGTFVNGERVEDSRPVETGDIIKCGRSEMRFERV